MTRHEAIAHLHHALDAKIPAFLMSGDMDPGPQRAAQAKGYVLLHKPVEPMTLRATLMQMVSKNAAA